MTMAATGRRGIDLTLNQREIRNGTGSAVVPGDVMLFNEERLASTPTVDTNKVGRDTSGKVVCLQPAAGAGPSNLIYGKFCVMEGNAAAGGGQGAAIVTGDDVLMSVIFDGNEPASTPIRATAGSHSGTANIGAAGEKIIATLNDPHVGGAVTALVSVTLRGDTGYGQFPDQ